MEKYIDMTVSRITKTELKKLNVHGFEVLLLTVSKCFIGKYQTLYEKKHVKSTVIITNLFI